MTTSKGIILLLLEQNSESLLVAGWFYFPKNWLELEVHSPFVALSVGMGRIWELGLLEQA